MRTLRNISRKAAGTSGETMVETLVSILVSSLAIILLATAINAAVNSVKTSQDYMEDFYVCEGDMVTSYATSSTDSADIDLGVYLDKDETSTSVAVDVYESEDDSGIALYKRSDS